MSKAMLIIGIILIVIFVVIALIILIKIHKNLVNEDIQMNSIADDNLINDTRGPTIVSRPDIYKQRVLTKRKILILLNK